MKHSTRFAMAAGMLLISSSTWAQHAGHGTGQPAPKEKPATANPQQPPQSQPVDHSKMDHSQMQGMDHSKMDHGQVQGMDHSKMDHGQMQGMDHSKMDQAQMRGMDQSIQAGTSSDLPADAKPREPIPHVTEEDRDAAFPPVHDHHKHGTSIQSYSLIDRLEVSRSGGNSATAWEAMGWVGGDVQKFWWRSEGHAAEGRVERGSVEALYGRGIRAWWDMVAGVRQDFGEGPSRTWVGLGVQSLAPYKFEVSATAYVGPRGRTALRAGAEYDTLLTNRLILQWRAEMNAYGKDDVELGIGSGLSTIEAGARLRYEITRKFAPYIGIEHDRAFGRTAEFRRSAGGHGSDTKVVAGVRIWF